MSQLKVSRLFSFFQWSTFFKGIAMGAADVVPGVSGGTVAFITGIYSDIIEALNAISFKLLRTFKSQGLVGVWQTIRGPFLVSLGCGVALSIISLAKIITWLLEHYPPLVWSFFLGLVVASALVMVKQVRGWDIARLFFILLGFLCGLAVTRLVPSTGEESSLYVFFSGFIAICAMILPGISGSFILLILGMYSFILEALITIELKTIVIFSLGCLTGLLSFARVLKWLFHHYHYLTMCFLIGILWGSINKLWPWKEVLDSVVNRHGKVVPLVEKNISPGSYFEITGGEPFLMYSVFFMVVGFVFVWGMERYAHKKG